MNERIQELAEQCFAFSKIVNPGEPQLVLSESLEKFAKLIVRETLNEMGEQMDKFGDDQSNNPTWYKSMEAVEKRFGMKERMNKRIRELAEQAFFETEYDDVQNLPETMERFAELIVRECVEVANKTVIGSDFVGNAIRNHFGVE
jgi:hypothetical protein